MEAQRKTDHKKFLKIILTSIVLLIVQSEISVCYAQDLDTKALDRYIEKSVNEFEITGLSIAVIKNQEIIYKRGFGWSDLGNKEKMKPEAVFNIASLTKAFTTAAIGLLVEEGRLSWDTKVVDLIPDFNLADPYITRNLNIEDILSHRSGLGTFYGDLLWYETDYTMEEVIDRLQYLPVTNDFRSEFGYQNCMYILAGEIIETITGQSWSDFLYERILHPLQMINTVTNSTDLSDRQTIAYPHLKQQKTHYSFPIGNPAASIFSNVEDMSHWIVMLLNNGSWNNRNLIQAETIDKFFQTHINRPISDFNRQNGTQFRGYALGWNTYDYAGRKILEHGGGMPGYVSKIALVPEEDLGLIILTNSMSSLPTPLMYYLLDLMLNNEPYDWTTRFLEYKILGETRERDARQKRHSSKVDGTSPTLSLENYVGIYTDKMYGDAVVEMRNKILHLTLEPTAGLFTSEMLHWHFNTFRIKFKDEYLPEGYVTFSLDSYGEITGFTIDLPNPDFHFFYLDFKRSTD